MAIVPFLVAGRGEGLSEIFTGRVNLTTTTTLTFKKGTSQLSAVQIFVGFLQRQQNVSHILFFS